MKFMRQIVMVCVIVVLAVGGAIPCEITGEQIVAKVRPGHPRLMMTEKTVAGIRAGLASDPWLKGRYTRQKRAADALLGEPVSSYALVGGDGLLDTSRRVLRRVSTLAIVYRVDGDKKYLERCWAELDAAAHFKDWDEVHFLDTAEMTAAFAIAYDWLYDAWTPEQRQTLRQAIIKHGLTPGLTHYAKYPKVFAARINNWNVVCNGGLAMGALAIADESPEIAGRILANGLASVPRCLSQFAPDGAWAEGPMYWVYATLFESMYLDSLQTACGTDFGLGDIPGVEKGGWFPAYFNGPAGGSFNFADAEEDSNARAGPQLLWMARRFHEPRYAQYQIDYSTGRVPALDLIWGAGIEHRPWQTIEPDRYFGKVEVAAMRDGWDDPKGWFVAIKAGSNAVSHAHLDIGTFVLEAKGVRWAIDLGPDSYDLPGYFEDQRWDYYRLRAEGHNTLVLNPGQGPDQDGGGSGKITSFTPTPRGVELAADLTGAYPAADQVTRSLSFVRGRSATINDVVKLKRAGEVWWFLQTRAAARPSADGRMVTLEQEGQNLTLKLLSPASAHFDIGSAEPLATSPHPSKQAINTGVSRIAVHLAGVRDATISVRFE